MWIAGMLLAGAVGVQGAPVGELGADQARFRERNEQAAAKAKRDCAGELEQARRALIERLETREDATKGASERSLLCDFADRGLLPIDEPDAVLAYDRAVRAALARARSGLLAVAKQYSMSGMHADAAAAQATLDRFLADHEARFWTDLLVAPATPTELPIGWERNGRALEVATAPLLIAVADGLSGVEYGVRFTVARVAGAGALRIALPAGDSAVELRIDDAGRTRLRLPGDPAEDESPSAAAPTDAAEEHLGAALPIGVETTFELTIGKAAVRLGWRAGKASGRLERKRGASPGVAKRGGAAEIVIDGAPATKFRLSELWLRDERGSALPTTMSLVAHVRERDESAATKLSGVKKSVQPEPQQEPQPEPEPQPDPPPEPVVKPALWQVGTFWHARGKSKGRRDVRLEKVKEKKLTFEVEGEQTNKSWLLEFELQEDGSGKLTKVRRGAGDEASVRKASGTLRLNADGTLAIHCDWQAKFPRARNDDWQDCGVSDGSASTD